MKPQDKYERLIAKGQSADMAIAIVKAASITHYRRHGSKLPRKKKKEARKKMDALIKSADKASAAINLIIAIANEKRETPGNTRSGTDGSKWSIPPGFHQGCSNTMGGIQREDNEDR